MGILVRCGENGKKSFGKDGWGARRKSDCLVIYLGETAEVPGLPPQSHGSGDSTLLMSQG